LTKGLFLKKIGLKELFFCQEEKMLTLMRRKIEIAGYSENEYS